MCLTPFTVFADVTINEICWPVKAAYAANGLKTDTIIINEVAWMGTQESYNDEWLELYNSSNSAVSLGSWTLKAVDGTPEINLSGTISGLGFYLLERTDDDTLIDITADQIYKGSLSNKGEHLELYDNLGDLIDSIDCSNVWLAGDNSSKATMERTSSGDWQTSKSPGGTPNAENSSPSPISPVSHSFTTSPPISNKAGEELPEDGPLETPLETQTYPIGIIINEILPSPEGPDKTEEWIELKNLNNQTIDISNWKIQDTIGSIKIYTFPENTKILPQGFLFIERPVSKITLNNSGDGLKLLHPNNETADEILYGKASLAQSCNRKNNTCVWSSVLSPGSENIIRDIKSEESSSPAAPSTTGENQPSFAPDGAIKGKEQLASISSQISKPWSIIFIAILLAIFSAIIILILKKKVKRE